MRRLLAVSLVAASVSLATPAAHAVPPVQITGSGIISPGLVVPGPLYPVFIAFDGVGTSLGSTYACHFEGTGTNVPMGGATGTLNGYCGPIVYSGCAFTLTPTTWSIACPTSAGSLAVTYGNVNPTTYFSATGLMA